MRIMRHQLEEEFTVAAISESELSTERQGLFEALSLRAVEYSARRRVLPQLRSQDDYRKIRRDGAR